MKLSENSRKVKTHYEFVCYYEDKRVALIGNTLEDLLHKNAVKVAGWLKYNNFKNVWKAWASLTNTYKFSKEMSNKLFRNLIDYNNVEFDTPYAVELVKVTSAGAVIERFPFKLEKTDIKSIIYQDYLNILSDEQLIEITNKIKKILGSDDIDSVFSKQYSYKFNREFKHIEFEGYDWYGTLDGQVRYCINEILMTENVKEIFNITFTDYFEVRLETDKGTLIMKLTGLIREVLKK